MKNAILDGCENWPMVAMTEHSMMERFLSERAITECGERWLLEHCVAEHAMMEQLWINIC